MRWLLSPMVWLLTGLALMLSPRIGAAAERLVVGVEDLRYLPYYDYADGQFGGMARELLDRFARSQGIEFEYRALPVKRLYVEFLAGKVDFKFPDNANWLSKEKSGHAIRYSAPLMPFIDGVLVLPARKGAGRALLKSLGTVQGFTAFDYLDDIARGQLRLVEIGTLEALFQTHLHGRIDGSYFNVVVADRYLANTLNQPGALVFDPALPHTRSHYHLSSWRRADVLVAFDEFLKQHPKLLTELAEKWQVPLAGNESS